MNCPICSGTLDEYTGANASKVGTGFCDKCGARSPLKTKSVKAPLEDKALKPSETAAAANDVGAVAP